MSGAKRRRVLASQGPEPAADLAPAGLAENETISRRSLRSSARSAPLVGSTATMRPAAFCRSKETSLPSCTAAGSTCWDISSSVKRRI